MKEKKERFRLRLPVTSIVFKIYPTRDKNVEKYVGILKLRVNRLMGGEKALIAVDEEGKVVKLLPAGKEFREFLEVPVTWREDTPRRHPVEEVKRYFDRLFGRLWEGVWDTEERMSVTEVQRGKHGFKVVVAVPDTAEWIVKLRDRVKKEGEPRPYGKHIVFAKGPASEWLPALHAFIRAKSLELEEDLPYELAKHARSPSRINYMAELLMRRGSVLWGTLREIEKILVRAQRSPDSKKALEGDVKRLLERLDRLRETPRKTEQAKIEYILWYIRALLKNGKGDIKKRLLVHHNKIRMDLLLLQRLTGMTRSVWTYQNPELREKILKNVKKMLSLDNAQGHHPSHGQ